MAIGFWLCEKCGRKVCGKCCESETDKEFLKRLKENKLKWTGEEFKAAIRLSKIGLAKYEADAHSGWWEVTAEGEKYLNT